MGETNSLSNIMNGTAGNGSWMNRDSSGNNSSSSGNSDKGKGNDMDLTLTGCCLGSGFFGISANGGSLNIAKFSRFTHVKQHFRMENYENRTLGI